MLSADAVPATTGTTADERRKRAEFLSWAFEDFQRFAGILEIIPKDGSKKRLVLNDIQRRYCRERTQRDAVLKPRQIGFTTLEQARDVYRFVTEPGARVVVTCQSATDHTPALLLSANYQVMFESLRRAGLRLDFRSESNTKWVLADRDSSLRIIESGASESAAKKKGRAGTISRLHLTETAFYEFADETLNALLEAVPGPEHGSEIVSESTANGAGGFFYRQCRAAMTGQSGYKLHFYPWFEAKEYAIPLEPGERVVPEGEREELLAAKGVRPEQLKWYRRKVLENGQANTDQEYPSDPETCFLVSGRGFFEQPITESLLKQAIEPIERRDRGRIAIWKRPQPGRAYIISVDTSEGGGGDPSGALIYDWLTAEHIGTLFGQYAPWDLAKVSAELGLEYNCALVAVERNNHGHAVLQALIREQGYPNVYVHDDEKFGWPTSPVTRPMMLDELEAAHRGGHWKSPDRLTLGQFKTFVHSGSGKPEAASGECDELVLAAAIGWAVRSRVRIPSADDLMVGGVRSNRR
jgi:hypothetical protein